MHLLLHIVLYISVFSRKWSVRMDSYSFSWCEKFVRVTSPTHLCFSLKRTLYLVFVADSAAGTTVKSDFIHQWMQPFLWCLWGKHKCSPMLNVPCLKSLNQRNTIRFMNVFGYLGFQFIDVRKSVCVVSVPHMKPSFWSCLSFQVFDDGDLLPVSVVRTQAVQTEAAVSGQSSWDGTERERHVGVSLSVLAQVDWQRPLPRGHFLVDGCVNS